MTDKTFESLNWCQKQRLIWIKEMIDIYGFIQRNHVVKKFGVSNSAAAKDFQLFNELFPDHMEYDANDKVYRAKSDGGENG